MLFSVNCRSAVPQHGKKAFLLSGYAYKKLFLTSIYCKCFVLLIEFI